MPLAPGTRLGAFEVISAIGAGGMGEVYRARDSRLGRDVALKILPEEFAGDAERLARFQREAQLLASLNHPHIAAIHGLEEGPVAALAGNAASAPKEAGHSIREESASGLGRTFKALVLELVEGETLAERIERGPVPLDEALTIARQILDALEAAHEQGIIHRDLKPANIKITPGGNVKVLDFGLAKLAGPEGGRYVPSSGSRPPSDVGALRPELSQSPTMTGPTMKTGVGILLGTAAYMAPEQARGKVVDRRADIWSFGCVLFEMLTATRPFEGSDVTELLASVIKSEPPWHLLPANTPPAVRTVLRRCLQKDPAQRIRDAGDVGLALGGAFDAPAAATPLTSPTRRRVIALSVGAALIAAVITGGVVWVLQRPEPTTSAPVRFQIAAPPNSAGNAFVISPDGRQGAFLAVDSTGAATTIWLHSFETGETRQVERASGTVSAPFWSPDSRFIGYAIPGALMKVDVSGGPPQKIAEVTSYNSGAWSPSGVILIGRQDGGLMQTPASGGTLSPVTSLEPARQERRHSDPSFLPDGRRFIYLRTSTESGNSGVYVGSLDATPEKQSSTRLLATEQEAIFAASPDTSGGYLLFVRGGTLMAQPLDTTAAELIGEPVAVADVGSGPLTSYSASRTGALTYGSGGFQFGGTPSWVDRAGRVLGPAAVGVPSNAVYPQLSPDGTRLAIVSDGNVWVHHVMGPPPIKVTFEGGAFSPLWTRDGQRLAYEKERMVRMLPADGSGGMPQPLTREGHYHPHGWSLDGRRLIVAFDAGPGQQWNILHVPIDGDHMPEGILETPATEGLNGVALSPDGRWLAYASNVTGSMEIWVRPYPGPGAPMRVSPDGGAMPVWARDGRELYYASGARLMAAAVDARAAFSVSPPQVLFEDEAVDLGGQPPSYDVSAGGRFVMIKRNDAGAPAPVSVILNWTAATFARREPQ